MSQLAHVLLGAYAWLAVIPSIIDLQCLELPQRDRLSLRNIFGVRRLYGAILFEFGEGWGGKGFMGLWLDELRTVMWMVRRNKLPVALNQHFLLKL